MAGRNKFNIDWSQFEEYAIELEKYGQSVKQTFTNVMEQEVENVQADTLDAVSKANLPANGKYSQGDTQKAIDLYPKVEWSGTTGSIGLGFDKTKPNAGTFLITGTPKMRPDYELEKIYVRKKYVKEMTDDIFEYFMDSLKSIKGNS